MDAAEFDRFAGEYHRMHSVNIAVTGEAPEYFAEYKIRVMADLCRRDGKAVRSIVDFGAGIGNSIPWFMKYFSQAALTNADVSRRSLDLAEQRFPGAATSLYMATSRIPASDNEFDAAFSACVFHHIPHEEHVHWLTELRRVVRCDGRLMIFEHNPLNPLTQRAVNTCPFDENARLIGARQFAARARAAGWAQVKVRYHVFFPRFMAALRPAEPWLSAIPLGAQYAITAVKAG